MRPLAKILLAGTCVATVASAASAQTAIDNVQGQFGDVVDGQRLNVVDPEGGAIEAASASGNAVAVGVEDDELSFTSSQELGAAVRADARVRVHGWSEATRASANAAGNTGDASADGGWLNAEVHQLADGPVSARARVRGEPSATGDASASATALANSHNFRAGGSSVAVAQEAYGAVDARGRADLTHVFGQTDVSATAVGNNTDSQGGGAYVNAWQLRGGEDATRAVVRANVGYGEVVNATSVASANNLSAAHAGSIPNLTAVQESRAPVIARTRLSVDESGAAYASADGMGNNAFAGVYAPDSELALDLTQDNAGEITVSTDFDGGAGSDASVRASAMGNTVVGFACTDCDATLDATSHQTNSGAVTATTRARSGAGSTGVTVQAIGNNAIYQVTSSGQ